MPLNDFDKTNLQEGIRIVMWDFRRVCPAEEQSISVNDIWFLMIGFKREEVMEALEKMEDVKILDAAKQYVYLPKEIFFPRMV